MKIRAIALISGGLDSLLAVKITKAQNIEVIGLNFSSPFFGIKKEEIKRLEKLLDIKIVTIDISKEYIEKILLNPPHGYGKNANPCIDCHAFMVRKAFSLLQRFNAKFLVTGEVLNERPFSQNPKALKIVESDGGAEGLLVRPLSAKLLPETYPEKMGWVQREKLYDISGRTRKMQFELAKKFNITSFPSPAGGCILTDPAIGHRIMSLIKLKVREPKHYHLTRIGRHIWLNPYQKIIIPRNQTEDEIIIKFITSTTINFKILNYPGPTALCYSFKHGEKFNSALIARIYSRYLSHKHSPPFIIAKFRGKKLLKKIIVNERIQFHKELIEWQE